MSSTAGPTELALVDMGLTEIPAEYIASHASSVTTVNLTENAISPPANLQHFTKCQTLILDKNGLESLAGLPIMPSVVTLWINNNNISDLVELLDQISLLFPNLNFLSFMRNPASAPLVCVGQSDVEASRRYRVYTCFRLPKLQMLDSSMVTPEERKQAAEGGKYLAVRKPKKPAPAGSAGGAPGEAEGTSAAGSAGSAGAGAGAGATGGADKLFFGSGDAGAAAAAAAGAAAAAEGEKRGGAYLGLGTTHYDGRHSEGNRFIVDRDL